MKTLILTLAICSSLFTFSQNLRSPEEVKAFNKEFIRLLNIERKKLNLDTLIESTALTVSSMNWSKTCIDRTKFEHSDISKLPIEAECIDLGTNKSPINEDANRVLESFKSSSSHWKILMSKDYKYIGTGEYIKRSYMTISIGSTYIRELRTNAVTTVHLN